MLKQPKCNSRHGSDSLRYQGAKLWNALITVLRLQVITIIGKKNNALALPVISAYSRLWDMLWLLSFCMTSCDKFMYVCFIHTFMIACTYTISVVCTSENSLLANVCFCIVPDVK